ncbi:MAG: alpha/beta hydrolase, partial [Asticcacaulis sp.]|nr:alpha/beta hydrolase [Asticcacaulis sp.]
MAYCRPLVTLAALSLALSQTPALAADQLPATGCTAAGKAVDEKGFVRIGGIEQWVRIKGSSCANPIVVIVHGGPGNPSTTFGDNVYRAWEQEFTIVQWDQRGAGKTYGRNPPKEDDPLVVEQLRDDGIAVARYATQRLGKRKSILMGGSWGSVLGVYMAKSNPELFCGYISSSQVVGNAVAQRGSYDATLALARAAKDEDSIAKLEALGPPPWTSPRNPGIVRRVMRKYEAMSTEPAPKWWWTPAPEYSSPKDEADYTAGEDYSWLQFVGLKGKGIASTIDMVKLGPRFELPFYMVQGEQDLLTMPEPSKRYFDFIEAPHKEFVMVPRTGHDPNPPMVETQFRL